MNSKTLLFAWALFQTAFLVPAEQAAITSQVCFSSSALFSQEALVSQPSQASHQGRHKPYVLFIVDIGQCARWDLIFSFPLEDVLQVCRKTSAFLRSRSGALSAGRQPRGTQELLLKCRLHATTQGFQLRHRCQRLPQAWLQDVSVGS